VTFNLFEVSVEHCSYRTKAPGKEPEIKKHDLKLTVLVITNAQHFALQ